MVVLRFFYGLGLVGGLTVGLAREREGVFGVGDFSEVVAGA
jgi:hypothetical protein